MTRPQVLDRSRFELEVDETFEQPVLDADRWIPAYLPHWSTPDRTAARYDLAEGRLRLRIDADQPPWCPELDGDLRVSSLQTAVFAGPLGSSIGGHRFHADAVVRTAQEHRVLVARHHGLIETRLAASADPRLMVAHWMVGIGDAPGREGEICVTEIFGRDVDQDGVRVGMGVHPFGDPSIPDDFEQVPLAIDATAMHTYSVVWDVEGVAWYVDDRLIRTVALAPDYPLQLMLGLYEFPPSEGDADDRPAPAYPKVVEVDWVRSYRLVS